MLDERVISPSRTMVRAECPGIRWGIRRDSVQERGLSPGGGRGVVVALTDAGIARLVETAPAHARGISKLFVEPLDDQELEILERALGKVIIDCSFS